MHELRIERSVNTHRLWVVSLMRCTIPSVNSTLRIARALNDPYGSNELNLSLADRYSAGVLDMTERSGLEPWPGTLQLLLCSWARHFTLTVPLSTQVYKWVPANGNPAMGVEILQS